jgi:hypothetical protein
MIERLDARELLTALPSLVGVTFAPMYQAVPFGGPSPPAGAKTPTQIRQAYDFAGLTFNGVAGDGAGQTIAIVEAYDDANIQDDLNTFDAQFGLPATTVTRVNQTGGTAYPGTDSSGGWEMEASLDVEWAHAIAPGASILLVEANSPNGMDLMAGVDYAAAHASVVSMSWGGDEFSGETSFDGRFSHAGVAFVASSGDSGAPVSWPAASSNVLSVGGTTLTLDSDSSWAGETAWSGSGGGPSAYEARPDYQSGIVTQTTMRANPDVAYDANPGTGYAVYDSFAHNGAVEGWVQLGGTSAGAPQWAALLAIADQGRALNGSPALDAFSPTEVMTNLYQHATSGQFHDITSGTSTGTPNYTAAPGYDYVTGLGSPNAGLVISALVGSTTTPTPSDHLAVSAPATATAGASFNLTVTAKDSSNATDTGYLGTVRFSSTDAQAGLPADYTFTAADGGTHTFTVTLKSAGPRAVTATDKANPAIAGMSSSITVSPAAASQFVLTGLPSSDVVGLAASVTVTASDAYGNAISGYTGTVHFTSTDTWATLPASYAFTTADRGVHSFSVTFNSAGTQSLTVADAAGLTGTQSLIQVTPAAPSNLSATSGGSSQISLSWSPAAGAWAYSIERSNNILVGWAPVGYAPAGTTTYVDIGLSDGTTYSYRVRATGGGQFSTYSNTSSATTSIESPTRTVGTGFLQSSPLTFGSPAPSVTITTPSPAPPPTAPPKAHVPVRATHPRRAPVAHPSRPPHRPTIRQTHPTRRAGVHGG